MSGITTPNVFNYPDGRMDRKNAAIYLGCQPKTLADWATRGIGPAFSKVGGRVFYFRNDLDDFIRDAPRGGGKTGKR